MIRIMTPDDYDDVRACWMSCTGMGLNTIDDSREGIIRYLERNPNTCFVDEQEGTITGAILAGHDGRRGYIYHTAVNPAYRHQGIGTALVNAALHALANEGIVNRLRRFLTQRCRQRLLGTPRFHCARRSNLPQQSPVRHHPHRHVKSDQDCLHGLNGQSNHWSSAASKRDAAS